MKPIFFFGSLRDLDLLQIVMGREVAEASAPPARAFGYSTRRLADESYPILVETANGEVEGRLLMDCAPADLARLEYFEEAEYGLAEIQVTTADGPVGAQYFAATGKAMETDLSWSFDDWRRRDRAVALLAAREYMDHYGRVPVEDIDRIWPGIMTRAYQKARAAAEPGSGNRLRSGFGKADVDWQEMRRPYTHFMAVEEHRLRYRRFDGGWSAPVGRSVAFWGDAVTVLPFDPARGAVLLVEQFRPAPAARGEANAWCIEVVAGRIDTDEDAETTARRETAEEAGLTLGRLAAIPGYYTTPGLAAEKIYGFVGEADLSAAGGVHGLSGEEEDIRTLILPLDEALQAVSEGEVNTGTALVSLLWLKAHRDQIEAAWRDSPVL